MNKWFEYLIIRVTRHSLRAAYRAVFESDQGKVVLNDLSIVTNFMRTTHNSNPTDAAFNEGKRAAFSYILKMLRKQPEDTQTLADREVLDDRPYDPGADLH